MKPSARSSVKSMHFVSGYAFSSINIVKMWSAVSIKLLGSIQNSLIYKFVVWELSCFNNETDINVQIWASVYFGLSHFCDCCKTSLWTHFQKSISPKPDFHFVSNFQYSLTVFDSVIIRRTSCWKWLVTRILMSKNELPFTFTNFSEFCKVWFLIAGPSSNRLVLFQHQSSRILNESAYANNQWHSLHIVWVNAT